MKISQELYKTISNYEHVIWDWNGTIINDIAIAVDVINDILSDNGLPTLTVDSYREKFCFPIIKYYSLLGFDYDKTPFGELADQFIEKYDQAIKQAQLFSGMTELLSWIIDTKKSQSILSAASQLHLTEIVERYKLTHFFSNLYGIEDHYAASKIERGKELIKDSNIPVKKTLLIGDTDHDLEVGKEIGVDVLLLGDGHQTYERLNQIHDKVLASRFEQQQ